LATLLQTGRSSENENVNPLCEDEQSEEKKSEQMVRVFDKEWPAKSFSLCDQKTKAGTKVTRKAEITYCILTFGIVS